MKSPGECRIERDELLRAVVDVARMAGVLKAKGACFSLNELTNGSFENKRN